MCGRFNATFESGMKKLYTSLNIHKVIDKPIDKRFVKAADTISIIRNKGSHRQVENATWWLLLEQTETGFKPSKFTSFNTRYDKLNTSNSAGYQAFRQSRCIIAAKSFGETEFVNKKPQHYYDMEAETGGLVFGGLCRDWQHSQIGEIKTSCSVITLQLILPQNTTLIDQWLDNNNNVDQFNPLLIPNIPQTLIAQQIDKPSTYNAISEQELISTNDN